jgi:phosphoribosylamine---glycine ligase
MNVLLIGNGGREHAIAQLVKKSPSLTNLFIAPGNPGTAMHGKNVAINITDFHTMENFCVEQAIKLIIVGPEGPLVEGISDHFSKLGIAVVGPSAYGAQLEGSKAFAKKFMQNHDIPTAGYFECSADNLNEGLDFLSSMNPPYVLKADGLAAGKGVLIIDNLEEAQSELKQMLDGKFGAASATVVIEEFLDGIEFSVFAITDGKSYLLLPEAKDYKRIGEKDSGLNTGGMGAVSPVPFLDEVLKNKVIDKIVKPTIDGFAKEEMDYKGFVFFGLIRVGDEPFVIEYNCRMGDPETEVVMPRINSDILPIFASLASQTLHQHTIELKSETFATVMLVSGGYPGDYPTGKEISIGELHENSFAYHAGTKMIESKLVTSGGRVMSITSQGSHLQDALDKSYASIENIKFDGMYFRKDIGQDLL